jgi:hypothetical protein
VVAVLDAALDVVPDPVAVRVGVPEVRPPAVVGVRERGAALAHVDAPVAVVVDVGPVRHAVAVQVAVGLRGVVDAVVVAVEVDEVRRAVGVRVGGPRHGVVVARLEGVAPPVAVRVVVQVVGHGVPVRVPPARGALVGVADRVAVRVGVPGRVRVRSRVLASVARRLAVAGRGEESEERGQCRRSHVVSDRIHLIYFTQRSTAKQGPWPRHHPDVLPCFHV